MHRSWIIFNVIPFLNNKGIFQQKNKTTDSKNNFSLPVVWILKLTLSLFVLSLCQTFTYL